MTLPGLPLWDDPDELVARLLAICGEAISIRTGMAIEGLRSLKTHQHGHLMLRFDYVWSSGRQPLVIRIYRSDNSPWARTDPPAAKARREFALLGWLARCGFPVPNPIWLEAEGAALDHPALLMPAMAGHGWEREAGSREEVVRATFKRLAFAQARIHAAERDGWPGRGRLPTLALDTVLAFLADLARETGDEQGLALLDELATLRPKIVEMEPVLVHGDFQLSNLLFQHGEISAILDWEAAVWADPRWDVAFTRFSVAPFADEYLATYELAASRSLPQIHFWDALVAIRAAILHHWHAGRTPHEPTSHGPDWSEIARNALRRARDDLG
jgi:aminoglycoside phosphotransferase (APT) family kinase protein